MRRKFSVAFSVFFWLNEQPQETEESVELVLPDNPPDIYITGMDLTRFDNEGHVIMTTKADSLAVYEASGKSYLTFPDVILSENDQETWQILANDRPVRTQVPSTCNKKDRACNHPTELREQQRRHMAHGQTASNGVAAPGQGHNNKQERSIVLQRRQIA